MLTISLVFIIVPLIIRLTSKGPALFKQVRIGKNAKPFTMYKFRTMILEQYDEDGIEIMPEDRITKVGKLLRKTSLDETPQLLNILNGTMSFVGPRPMLAYQIDRCIGEEKLRFEVKPGVTGLAQVNGRNNIDWTERIKYDVEYVKTLNFFLDIKILFKTIVSTVKREGTNIVPEFRGVDRFSRDYIPPDEIDFQ